MKTRKPFADGDPFDWPAPEEIIQRMAEDLLTRCAGSYTEAHAAVDEYDERKGPPMCPVAALMAWCEDKTEVHDAIEWHRQMRFVW
jgi:hypothetical protein